MRVSLLTRVNKKNVEKASVKVSVNYRSGMLKCSKCCRISNQNSHRVYCIIIIVSYRGVTFVLSCLRSFSIGIILILLPYYFIKS